MLNFCRSKLISVQCALSRQLHVDAVYAFFTWVSQFTSVYVEGSIDNVIQRGPLLVINDNEEYIKQIYAKAITFLDSSRF